MAIGSIEIGLVEGKIEAGIDSVRNSVNAIINKYRVDEDGPGDNYVEFQEFHRVHSEKPLYPNLESEIREDRRPASDSLGNGSIIINRSFLNEKASPKSKSPSPDKRLSQHSEGQSAKEQEPVMRRISTHSDESRPSRDVNSLRNDIKSSGNRFSMERLSVGGTALADSVQLAMVPTPGANK